MFPVYVWNFVIHLSEKVYTFEDTAKTRIQIAENA